MISLWTLALQLGYVLSRSDVHSPFLKFAGVHLERLTPEDIARFGHNLPVHLQNAGFVRPAMVSILQGSHAIMASGAVTARGAVTAVRLRALLRAIPRFLV